MRHFRVEPDVPGGLGPRTIFDRRSLPPRIVRLHYQFDGWSDDALFESHPVFITTVAAGLALEREKVSGVHFAEMITTRSDKFTEMYPGRSLPKFVWMQITGRAFSEDAGLAHDGVLVLSERALKIFVDLGLNHAKIEQASPPREHTLH